MASDHAKQPGASPISGLPPPVETRWQPGQSANPGGRPKFRAFSAAMRRLADLTPEELAEYQPATVAEDVALAAIRNAKLDPRYATHLFDRTEGKVPDELSMSGGPAPLQIVLAEAVRPREPDASGGASGDEGTDGSEAVPE